MNVLIFGTGEIYHRYKNDFLTDVRIIGFLDNNPAKQNNTIDGCTVYMPQEVVRLEYDYIFLMSVFHVDMREQLHELMVPDDKIIDLNQRGKILQRKKSEIYGAIDYNTEKMAVVFSHSLVSTGAQNALFTLVMTIKKQFSVVIISLEDGSQRNDYLKNNIPVVISEDILNEGELLNKLVESADILWVNTAWLYYIVDYIKRFDKSVFWWLHETITEHDISKRVFSSIISKECVHILSVSLLIDDNIYQTYGNLKRIKRLLFGIEDYTTNKNGRMKRNKKVTLACIGGISYIKGQDILIEAVSRLPQKLKNRLKVLIVGRGSLGEYEQGIIANNECINFLGEVEHNKIREIYDDVDGIVCCSRKESVSVVVAEACMNEKFSIVSDCAGITEYMVDGINGLIFENENIDELLSKIVFVIENSDYAYRIGKASRKVYEENFTMKQFEESLRSLFDETID